MPEKFENKYRIASHRKPGWDYSSNGMYFITLVTQNRVCNLGYVYRQPQTPHTHSTTNHSYVQLSNFGKIVDAEWHKSFEIRNELLLDQYVIMPNHLHAIVLINNELMANDDVVNEITDDVNDDDDDVETHGRASLQSQPQPQQSKSQSSQPFYRLPKSISSFLAGFKSAVNSKIDDYIDENDLDMPKYNRNNHFFQPNYHDHIIRDEQSYKRISEYIINNPAKWANDKFHLDDN
jgi:REP element-mobilizing transposase RayT